VFIDVVKFVVVLRLVLVLSPSAEDNPLRVALVFVTGGILWLLD